MARRWVANAAAGVLVLGILVLPAMARPHPTLDPLPVAAAGAHFDVKALHWVRIDRAQPTVGLWDGPYDARVGRDNGDPTLTRYRSYFQLETAPLAGRHILSATLSIVETYAGSCTPETVQLWESGPISAGTTWNTAPALIRQLDSVSAAKGGPQPSCADPGRISFNALPLIVDAAAANRSTVTVALTSAETSGSLGAKSFEPDPVIVVEYNTAPAVPLASATASMPDCASGSAGYIATTTPALGVRAADSDGQPVQVTFQWATPGGTVLGSTMTAASSTSAPIVAPVPPGALANGSTYRWHAMASDGTDSSTYGTWCEFTVDTARPATPPTITSTVYPVNSLGAAAYTAGDFALGAAGVSDVVGYAYSLNSDARDRRVPAGAGGSAVLSLTPEEAGPNTLYVSSVDRAGNLSDPASYPFLVGAVDGPVVWWTLDDGFGDSALDWSFHGNDAAFHGTYAWADGRHGGGVRLSGVDGTTGRTTAPAVNTQTSFAVMAWARVTDTSGDRAIVSQAGAAHNGFVLEYDIWHKRWAFVMRSADNDQATEAYALSTTTPQVGVWTHLAGVYDQAAGRISLYVNGRLQGSTSFTSTWNATGAVGLGFANWYGFTPRPWSGDLDDVQIYARTVSAAEIRHAMAAEPFGPAAVWNLDEGTGTLGADSSGNGHTVTATGDVTWVPGASGSAVHLGDTSGQLSTADPVLDTMDSFTVSAWVRLSRTGATATAVSQDGSYDSAVRLLYTPATDSWSFALAGGDTPSGTPVGASVPSDTSPQIAVWTHLAGVYDKATGQLRLYVNGRLAGSTTYQTTWQPGGAFAVGRGLTDGFEVDRWPGDVDDVRVTNRALTRDEILAVMGGVVHGPSARWDLDEATGTVAADTSGNGNTLASTGTVSAIAGAHGGAWHFTGSGAAIAAGPVLATDRSFTVGAWVRLDSLANTATIISQDGLHDSGFMLRYQATGQRWELAMPTVDSASSSTVTVVSLAALVRTGTWTHVAAVYDAGTSELRLFLNGKLVAVTSFHSTWTATRQLTLGRALSNDVRVDGWRGDIDDVRVLDHAATAAEIAAMSGLPASGPVRIRPAQTSFCLTENTGTSSGFLYQVGCGTPYPAMLLWAGTDGRYKVLLDHPTFGPGCLGIQGGSTSANTPTEDSGCATGRGQDLVLEPASTPISGYRIRPTHSGLCLGILNDSTAAGAQLYQLACSPNAAGQVFVFPAG